MAQSLTLSEVLSSNSDLSQLNNLIAPYASGFSSLLSITFLAPNNAAVGAFLNSSAAANIDANSVSALLSYHVLQGTYNNFTSYSILPTILEPGQFSNVTGGQRVIAFPGSVVKSGLLQNSTVNRTIPFSGGEVMVINSFLTIPQNITTTGVALNLTSAIGAISALNLTSPLVAARDVTFFVPNNAAFQAVGGTLANLSTSQLTSVLEYHTVIGEDLYSTTLTNGSNVRTAQGGNVTITINNGTAYVNNVKILLPNVLTANGVIHIIDTVLNPSGPPFPKASASNIPFTSGVPTPTSQIATQDATQPVLSATTSHNPAASSSNANPPSSSSHTNVGAIAGGVVGGVVGLALIVLLIWWCRRKGYFLSVKVGQKEKSQPATTAQTAATQPDTYRDKPELPGKTGATVPRKELGSAPKSPVSELPQSNNATRLPDSQASHGASASQELSTQTGHSDYSRSREVESGFGPLEAEYLQYNEHLKKRPGAS